MKFANNLNKSIEDEINDICINNNKNILVLAGGGMKGLGLLGAIKYLEDIDIIKNIEIYAGTSIGLLISVLLIIGYKTIDIYKFTKLFDMTKSINFNINNLLTNYSINECDTYELIIVELLKNKNIDAKISLLEFYKITKKKVIGTTVCLNKRKIEYISHENYPELDILTFIRMSTAVPLLFPPIFYNNNHYIDGGLLDNFPIAIFDNQLEKVIGINIVSEYFVIKEMKNIIDYLLLIMGIFITNTVKRYEENKYKNIVYNLNMITSNAFKFNMTQEDKKKMFFESYEFMKNNYKIN